MSTAQADSPSRCSPSDTQQRTSAQVQNPVVGGRVQQSYARAELLNEVQTF